MLFERVKFLTSITTFDDITAQNDWSKIKKYACCRDAIEMINVRNTTIRISSFHLIVDETLYPY